MPTVKRLAADIMKCGKKKIWLDPCEIAKLKGGSSRQQVRQFIRERVIMKKPDIVHSRYAANKLAAAKAKGRHMGIGKRKGSKNARTPAKNIWMKKIRLIREELKRMKKCKIITIDEFNHYYLQAKGNAFKCVSFMVNIVEKMRGEKLRIQELAAQTAALKMKK